MLCHSPVTAGTVTRFSTPRQTAAAAWVGTEASTAGPSVPGVAPHRSLAAPEEPRSPSVEPVLNPTDGGAASVWWTGGAVWAFPRENSRRASLRWPLLTTTRPTAPAPPPG